MLAVALLVAAAAAGWGESDQAVIRAARPGTDVRAIGRLGIAGWNGREEVMILATIVSANGDATLLQASPLPDLPTQITAARREPLSGIDQLIVGREPRERAESGSNRPFHPGPSSPVVISWYAPAPVRDRTVVWAKEADSFLAQAAAFSARQGGRLSAADGAALRQMAARYLAAGRRYFVLEAADLSRGTYMVGPTSYRFRSDALFFPIPLRAPAAPPRNLQLFLLTRFEPQQQALPPGLRLVSYPGGSPIRFELSRSDAPQAFAPVAGLFSESDRLVFTALALGAPACTQDLVLRGKPLPALPRQEAVSPPPSGGRGAGRGGRTAAPGARRPGGAGVVTDLAWSPAGDRLCVVAAPSGPERGEGAAALLDLAKGTRREVALTGQLSLHGWSPDGKSLAFLDSEGYVQTVEVDRDWSRPVAGLAVDSLAGPDEVPEGWSPPAWSASGEWLALDANGNVFVVRRDGQGLRQVTEAPEIGLGSMGMARGRGGGPGRGQRVAPPLPYAWAPRREVLAYAEPDADGTNWSVQGYEPGTEQVVSVRGDLRLNGVRALAWQPGGGQLAALGVGRMAKQTIYLIPPQGAIRALPIDLTSVGMLWTGDGRTLLIRGEARGTQRLGVRAVDAARGMMRTLPPTHFLSDRDVTLVAARPGRDEIAFAIGTSVYLARADGSRWWRLQRTGRVALREMANPLERWQRDPVVLEATRRWRRATAGEGAGGAPAELMYGIWDGFLAHWAARSEGGATVPYRDLPERTQRQVLTGLIYQALPSASVDPDPAAVTVPEWYWWLDEARISLHRPNRSTVLLLLTGPEEANYAFAINPPGGSGRPARRALPWHLWWPALFGAAAVVVALLGWRQRRREQERPPETGGPATPG